MLYENYCEMCPYYMLTRVFLEERRLLGRVTAPFLKRKWENLKQKYKVGQFVYFHFMPYVLVSYTDSLISHFYIAVERKNRKKKCIYH